MEERDLLHIKNVLADSDVLVVFDDVCRDCDGLKRWLMLAFAFGGLTFEGCDVGTINGDGSPGIVSSDGAVGDHMIRQHVLELGLRGSPELDIEVLGLLRSFELAAAEHLFVVMYSLDKRVVGGGRRMMLIFDPIKIVEAVVMFEELHRAAITTMDYERCLFVSVHGDSILLSNSSKGENVRH